MRTGRGKKTGRIAGELLDLVPQASLFLVAWTVLTFGPLFGARIDQGLKDLPVSVPSTDFDGDGHHDLAAVSFRFGNVSVLLNAGNTDNAWKNLWNDLWDGIKRAPKSRVLIWLLISLSIFGFCSFIESRFGDSITTAHGLEAGEEGCPIGCLLGVVHFFSGATIVMCLIRLIFM